MRVLVSTTWGYGHVFPVVPLAHAFVAAGHEVLWATNEQACPLVTAAGLNAVPSGLDTRGVADAERRLRQATSTLPGDQRGLFAFPNMFGGWATPPMVADLLPLARDFRPDLLVHEAAELGSPLVGAVLGVPSVTHSFGGAVPATAVAEAGERTAGLWADHGLEPPVYAGCYDATYLDICPPMAQSQALDHIADRQPMRPVVYTGEKTGRVDRGTGPLVYLTLGTVQNHAAVLAGAVAGLAGLDVRVLVTVGPDGDPAALGPQPGNVQVERWVPQSSVFAHCAVVVSHGGSGTFLGALSHGLPQLCLPQAADQFRNAGAGTRVGAALSLGPPDATSEAIAAVVRRLLEEPAFRVAAVQVQKQIAAMPTPEQVVSILVKG